MSQSGKDEDPPAYDTMYPETPPAAQDPATGSTKPNPDAMEEKEPRRGSKEVKDLDTDKSKINVKNKEERLGSIAGTDKCGSVKDEQKHSVTAPDKTNLPGNAAAIKIERRSSSVKNEINNDDGEADQSGSQDDAPKVKKRRLMTHASNMTLGTKEVLVDFCNKTTAHGFSHIVKEGQSFLMRIFWLCVTMTGLVLLMSACYDVTVAALVYRGTSTEVVYHDLHSHGIKVPYMTICSLAGFWKSKMAHYNVSKALASYLLVAVRGAEVISPMLLTDPKKSKLLAGELRNYLESRNLTLTEMVNMLSPECEDVIVGCFSPSTMTNASLWWRGSNCCTDTFRPTLTSLGRCFTDINTEEAFFTQTIAGLLGGHRIIFAINSQEYMEYDHQIVSTISLAEAGIHVSLSNYDLQPSVATSVQALRIAPNTAASIALSISTLDRSERHQGVWPWSKSTCVTQEDYWSMSEPERALVEHNLYFYSYYRTCPLHYTNCSSLAFRFTNDTTPVCYPEDVHHQMSLHDEMTECLKSYLKKYNSSETMLCQTTMINQQQSHTTLLKEVVEAQQGITIKPNVNVSMMNVYYPQLGYTEYRERIPTIFTWFSSLGGQMGLFLGASFITLVELLFTSSRVLRVALTTAFTALVTRIKTCIHPTHQHPA